MSRRPFARLVASLLACAVVAGVLVTSSVLSGAPAGAGTDEIQRARQRAQAAARAVSDAETELGAIESELVVLEGRTARAEQELAALADSIDEIVISRYTSVGEIPLLNEADINDGVKAEALSRYVSGDKLDAIDAFTEAKADLETASAALSVKREQQRASIDRLQNALASVQAELKRLEELEAKRRAEEERRRREAAAAAAAAERSQGASAPSASPSRPTPVVVSGGAMARLRFGK